ncbi:hypothetical protein, partial [Burkholderia pseudomallei]|uniref:hypothetical protein n=1 Tax=Burkholderia pseudomallei TaxID=28450 RepID=UPI001C4AD1F4
WFKSHAWKACIGESLSGVRIPLSPPDMAEKPCKINDLQGFLFFLTSESTIKRMPQSLRRVLSVPL